MTNNAIDDGFAPELVEGAMFDGVWEMPFIHKERLINPPFLMRPFSRRGVTAMPDECICFYEHDCLWFQAAYWTDEDAVLFASIRRFTAPLWASHKNGSHI